MGLDIGVYRRAYVDEPSVHIPYSGFMRFRRLLATAEGFNLDEMDGYLDSGGRSWSEIDSPLVPLFNHSDSDGQLWPWECARIEPRLRDIVTAWDESDWYKSYGLRLADAMATVAADEEQELFLGFH